MQRYQLNTGNISSDQPYFAFGSVGLRTFYASGIFYDVRISHSTDGYLLTVPPTMPSQAPSHPTYAPSANTRDPTYAPSITSTTSAPTYGSSDQPTYNPSVSPILHTTTTSPTATVSSNPSWSPTLRPILTTRTEHIQVQPYQSMGTPFNPLYT
eukprot:511261_1